MAKLLCANVVLSLLLMMTDCRVSMNDFLLLLMMAVPPHHVGDGDSCTQEATAFILQGSAFATVLTTALIIWWHEMHRRGSVLAVFVFTLIPHLTGCLVCMLIFIRNDRGCCSWFVVGTVLMLLVTTFWLIVPVFVRNGYQYWCGTDRTIPLDAEQIDRLVQLVVSSEQCGICRDTAVVDRTMGRLPCGHDFHMQCVKDWLLVRPICPYCNYQLAE